MTYLIAGAGPVGRATAALLAARGDQAVLLSRSGAGPELTGVRHVALDLTDPAALEPFAHGATALFNCVNPARYHTWPTDWPPLAAALLTAAERSGAVLVTTSNLYAYGIPERPMREGDPDRPAESKGEVRARMWADALAAHRSGRVRAAEVRSSDYVGPAVGAKSQLARLLPALRAGKSVQVIGNPDVPHTWTDVRDVARTLVAVADTEAAWGKAWHTSSNPARSQREALADIARAGGLPEPRVSALPAALLAALGLVNPLLREVHRIRYQFDRPFVMDSALTQEALHLPPTPWDEVCRATASQN